MFGESDRDRSERQRAAVDAGITDEYWFSQWFPDGQDGPVGDDRFASTIRRFSDEAKASAWLRNTPSRLRGVGAESVAQRSNAAAFGDESLAVTYRASWSTDVGGQPSHVSEVGLRVGRTVAVVELTAETPPLAEAIESLAAAQVDCLVRGCLLRPVPAPPELAGVNEAGCADPNDPECVAAGLRERFERSPGDAALRAELYDAYLALGVDREEAGDLPAARDAYQQAYDLDPRRLEATAALDRLRPYDRVLYADDFEGTENFATGRDEVWDSFYADGAFTIRMKQPDYNTWYLLDHLDLTGLDYAVAADVRIQTGATGSALLFFGADPAGWAHVLAFDLGARSVSVYRQHLVTGASEVLMPWTFVPGPPRPPVPDRIEVRVAGGSYQVIVNGVEVEPVAGQTRGVGGLVDQEGFVGFGVATYADMAERYFAVDYENFAVYELA